MTAIPSPLTGFTDSRTAQPKPQRRLNGFPITRGIGIPFLASAAVAAGTAIVSAIGIVQGSELYGTDPPLILVSAGGDLANLIITLPALIGVMWFAGRGSLAGLLMWPGALFYTLYVYAVYLVGAPTGMMLFAYATLVVLSATSLVVSLASIDTERVRSQLARTPIRFVGGALVIIAVAAYAGLIATAVSEFGSSGAESGFRPQWVIDCALGTPPLLIGGFLAWLRRPLGYATVGGLLFVSGLGGLAFAAAAMLQGLLYYGPIEWSVVGVHLIISAISFGLMVWFFAGRPRVADSGNLPSVRPFSLHRRSASGSNPPNE